jgi:hypothetical protein
MDTLLDLAKGNPGAANFLINLTHSSVPVNTVRAIENSGIVGADLYVLYSDLCGRDMDKIVKLVDNCPLDVLKDACGRQDYSGRELIAEYIK